ncbi:YbfB/YjiJ family MFS transporter [Ramlibacter henchirensis]|uniref:YbfB/YjiJ family MFS transporter n=1 Tax=Ramlibacter henchirensis TaxID=204072 RepID=A0A4Z0C710_9BURK|nr:YbfB/YjiJ family MFS transporter [Ramlibacter henchirensis]TFZ06682.1 YbfB/YjiJ family MFS transporter [Ramlibacter henchirensis]
MANPQAPHREPPAWAAGLAGLLSLAVAMGIGRFAFTPMLPLMLQAGQLDVAGGGWVAAANYAGYLIGALTAARTGWTAPRLAATALLGTAALTAAMALQGPLMWWAALRLLAGIASAWAFVATAIWCLSALARAGSPSWSSAVYAGVGGGIALAGLHCLAGAAAGVGPVALWLQLGALALVLSIPVLGVLARLPRAQAASTAASRRAAMPRGSAGLVVCYAVLGFGYILPATFLPVLAREVVEDPRIFGLAWPLFGATAAVSTLVAARLLRRASRVQVWAASHLLMGLGVLLPSLWRNGWTIALSALLVGGTFMVVTLAGVQEIRARAQGDATALVGRMTAAFALGQIAGPVLSSLLLRASPGHGLSLSLQAGALTLFASAIWLWRASAASSTRLQETSHAR